MASFFDKLIAPSDVPKDADVLEKISIEVKELHQKVSKYFSRLDKSKEPQSKSEKLSDLALQNEQKILDKVSLLEKSTAIFSNKITFTLPKNAKLLLSRLKLYDNSLSKIFGNLMTKVRMRIDKMMEKFTIQFYKDYADKKIKWFMESSKKVIGKFFQTLKDMPGNFFDKVYEVSFGLVSKILGVLGPIAKPFISMAGWFIKGGMKLLSTIFTAVTEILLLPLELMTRVSGFIAKGVLGLFRGLFFFMFTPPGLFFIGIPLLYFLGPKILSYIWEGIKSSAQYIDNMLIKHFGIDVRALWTDTIWPFVVEIWDSYKGSRLHAKITEYVGVLKLWFDSAMKYVFGDDIFDRIQGWWDSVTLYFDHVKSAFTFMWDNINWVYGIVTTHILVKIVAAFRTITSFISTISSFLKFIIGGIANFTTFVITRTANFTGKVFSKLFPRLASRLGKVFSFIGRIFPFIGKLSGIVLRVAGRLLSVVGWALTIWDMVSIGWAAFKALKAQAGFRDVLETDSTKIRDYISSLEMLSDPTKQEVSPDLVARYLSVGFTEPESIMLAQDDDKLHSIAASSGMLSSYFYNIRISARDQEEYDLAHWNEDILMDIKDRTERLKDTKNISYFDFVVLSYVLEDDLSTLRDNWQRIKNIANNRGLLRRNAQWQKTEGFTENLDYSINAFSRITNNFIEYARNRQRQYNQIQNRSGINNINFEVIEAAQFYMRDFISGIPENERQDTQRAFTDILNKYYLGQYTESQAIQEFSTLVDNKEAIQSITRAIENIKSIRIPPSKTFANGGIILQSQVDKVLPLDSTSLEIVYQHIKDIETEKPKNKEQNDLNRHITIIEETNNIIESFELYTMNRLSRGILGV